MAAISVRDIPDQMWEGFKASAAADGSTAEAKIRQWIVQEARRWNEQLEEDKVLAMARSLRRHDGQFFQGSLPFRMFVVQRDWHAVAYLALEQHTDGVQSLDEADWEYIRTEAAKDGVALDAMKR